MTTPANMPIFVAVVGESSFGGEELAVHPNGLGITICLRTERFDVSFGTSAPRCEASHRLPLHEFRKLVTALTAHRAAQAVGPSEENEEEGEKMTRVLHPSPKTRVIGHRYSGEFDESALEGFAPKHPPAPKVVILKPRCT